MGKRRRTTKRQKKKRRTYMLRALRARNIKLGRGKSDADIAKHYRAATGNNAPSAAQF